LIKLKIKCFFSGWLFSILLSCTAFVIYFLTIGHWLIVRQTPPRADAIHVLGGDSCDYHRTKHAISLHRSGIADTIIFTGSGDELTRVTKASEALGFPVAKRIVIDRCLSTMDEALEVKKLNKSWKSIILVTDIYHTRRAVHTFQKILPGVLIYSNPAYNSTYDEKSWWKTEAGFMAVFEETLKLKYYFVKYGVNPL
jgi:uncharacterized SAM-binding protein YcdF (DUF218 family)